MTAPGRAVRPSRAGGKATRRPAHAARRHPARTTATGRSGRADRRTAARRGGERRATHAGPSRHRAPAPRRPSSAERARRSRRARRLPVALAGLFALVVVGTSFPVTQLVSEHRQLAAAEAHLAAVRHEDHLLAEQRSLLQSPVATGRLARERYQLVGPGQTLYQVVGPAGTSAGSSDGIPAGDPAGQPLVPPSKAPNMTPQPGLLGAGAGTGATPGAAKSSAASSAGAPDFWGRVERVLEFWR